MTLLPAKRAWIACAIRDPTSCVVPSHPGSSRVVTSQKAVNYNHADWYVRLVLGLAARYT